MKAEKKQLTAKWSKREKDIMFDFPEYKADGHMLCSYLCNKRHMYKMDALGGFTTEEIPSLVQELELRGYDITTLKFSIQKKASPKPEA